MADSIELRMSVTSIKRVDPYAKDILATATHVALNSKSKIFGIWFFNREECIRITFLIESLMEGLKDKVDEKTKRKDRSVDIFNGPPTFSSTPRVPDVTSQSVMDFFAKASSKTSQKPDAAARNGENVLQRLMSNPAHSVEHIEKQQRSITPQEQISLRQKTTVNTDRRSVPISFPGPSSAVERRVKAENGLNVNSLTVSNQHQQSPLAFLLQAQAQNKSQSEKEETSELLDTSPFSQFSENCQKPHLMTPMMFTTPNSKENPTDASCEIDLLTEKQLAQALIYLLKNNSDFTKQIHEAYVQSIMERVNLNDKSFI
ncbi:hypothetical protein NQ317_016888 [Molorchus minor]|uniref:mRNA-decapping enzyme C-terminal domain-containing protein n=1 Tax=Molorchus minor TaxID=1323400 RepID=A0ABQ9K4P8_9CUCU|nr:hypothetical protein NQ317_016888 [Molorchus minor]